MRILPRAYVVGGEMRSAKNGFNIRPPWFGGPDRRGELEPALAVGGFDMFSLNKGTLVQQRDAFALIGEVVELPEKVVPGGVVRTGVNRIDGEDFLIRRIGQERIRIAANMVGTERQACSESPWL